MRRFKPNQEVVCVSNGWQYQDNRQIAPGPKKDELVTILDYKPDDDNYVIILGYRYDPNNGQPCHYAECCFEPLMDITEILECIIEQPQEICE